MKENQIKLIASDLDGTLLLPNRTLPAEIFPLIEALYNRGILFCPASGRQYESLRRLFLPVADKLPFIAENGAYVVYRGECIFSESIPHARLSGIFSAIQAEKEVSPLLCCQDCAYALTADNDPSFLEECNKYYPHFSRLASFDELPKSAEVCKIAVYDGRGAASHSARTLAEKLPDLRVIASGEVWSDISLPQTNKGKAFTFLQKRLGLSPEECMAFGDYMNDYEMLLACAHGYVPDNGYPPLIEKIGKTIPSNGDKGVIQKIKEVLGDRT
jgi:hypothetical protein